MSLSPEGSATCMWTSRCESDSSAAAGHLVEFHVSLCACRHHPRSSGPHPAADPSLIFGLRSWVPPSARVWLFRNLQI